MNRVEAMCERLERKDTKWLGSAGIAPLFNPDGPDAAALLRDQAEEIDRLRGALEPFANVADLGKRGGRFVIAKALYEDMGRSRLSAPRQSHWHWDQFIAARQALTQKGTT